MGTLERGNSGIAKHFGGWFGCGKKLCPKFISIRVLSDASIDSLVFCLGWNMEPAPRLRIYP